MKKNSSKGYVILGIIFALISIIAFAVPTMKTATFWTAYVFTAIAIVAQIVIWKNALGKEDTLKSKLDAEQKKLQSQKSDIELQIAGLEAQKETVPAKKQLDAIQGRIDELTAEKKALGLFKVKEKKVIQGKIDEVEAEATAARKLLDSQQSEIEETIVPLRGQLSDIVDKLSEITLEFERDR